MIKSLLPVLSIALLAAITLAPGVRAQDHHDLLPPSVTVSGTGQIFAQPDMAQINLGVTSEAPTASAALAQNNQSMSGLMKALEAKGIAAKDISTANFSIYPDYRENPKFSSTGNSPDQRISGYRVNNEVHVRVRKIADLGGILDDVVKAGANTVNGISFSLAEPAPALDEARKKAVADARRKAELLATASGAHLGRVIYINESGGFIPPPHPMMAMASRAVSSVPIAAGEQEMSVSVTITYAIE